MQGEKEKNIELEIVEIEEIVEKKEKVKYWEIRGNILWRTKKLSKNEWICSEWYDYDWTLNYVVNTDAWDAIELMRVAQTWDSRPRRFWLFFYVAIFITIGLIFSFLYFWYWKYTQSNIPTISNSPIPILEPKSNVEIIPVSSTWSEENSINNVNITEKNSLEMERLKMQTEFQLESLRLELQKRDITITSLQENIVEITTDNTLLAWTIKEENEKNKTCKDTLSVLQKKDTSHDAFLLELGRQTEKKCKETNADACKDLYYNFIQE